MQCSQSKINLYISIGVGAVTIAVAMYAFYKMRYSSLLTQKRATKKISYQDFIKAV